MQTAPLQLVAELCCKPGAEPELERLGAAFVERTRAQPGCTAASLHRVEEELERFVFVAEFSDELALERHLEAAWRQGAIADLPDLLVDWPRRFTLRRVA